MGKRTPILTVTIKDCEVQTFRAGGKGGQHQNKTETGVRIVHHPSGAVGESRETRSQLHNKQAAFKRMASSDKFQLWIRIESAKKLGHRTPEEIVDEMMSREEDFKIEYLEKA